MPKDKLKTIYVCNQCGETSPRWLGRCPDNKKRKDTKTVTMDIDRKSVV